MIELLQVIYGLIALTGALSAAYLKNPFDKLISLGVLAGGIIPFLIDRGYLDVGIAVALVIPVTTIFILLVCGREEATP
jgi:energy-converting hydrogenase A subunit D